MDKETWSLYVRNFLGSSKENEKALDRFASSGPLRLFFKGNEDPTYASKSLISVNNGQLCENGGDSILYSDDALPYSCIHFYVFFTKVKSMGEVIFVPQKLPC